MGTLNLSKRTPIKKASVQASKKPRFDAKAATKNIDIDINILMDHTPCFTPKGARTPDMTYNQQHLLSSDCNIENPPRTVAMNTSLFNGFAMSGERDVEIKIDSFMKDLNSKDPQCVKDNARVLCELLKSFAVSFNMEVEDILEISTKKMKRGGLSLKQIRDSVMQHLMSK